jgi:hypothetical protein
MTDFLTRFLSYLIWKALQTERLMFGGMKSSLSLMAPQSLCLAMARIKGKVEVAMIVMLLEFSTQRL